VNLHEGGSWRFKPFEDCPAIYTSKPPNWFQRLMWSWLLGVSWEKQR
jgi:hypothetical protein